MAENLNELRAQARKAHRAATKKASRLRVGAGVELNETKFDPRRNPANIKRYTTKQLQSYIGKLETFNSRKTQYVGDSEKRPIDANKWKQYKRAEDSYNKRINANFDKYKNIHSTHHGMTLGERRSAMVPDHPTAGSDAASQARQAIKRSPSGIKDEKSLAKLTKNMERRASPENTVKEMHAARKAYLKMMDDVKVTSLHDDVAELSDEQFMMLWNHTNFATTIQIPYLIAKDQMTKSDAATAGEQDRFDTQLREARDLVGWAKTVKLDS